MNWPRHKKFEVKWSMLSVMMLDDHDAVCCMIMFGVCYGWSMLSKMMLDDHDAVCCFLILVDCQMVHVVLCWLWCYMMTIMLSFLPFHNNRQQTFQIVQGDDCSAGCCLWWIGPKIFFDATWWDMMTLMRCCTFQNMHVLYSTYTLIHVGFGPRTELTVGHLLSDQFKMHF